MARGMVLFLKQPCWWEAGIHGRVVRFDTVVICGGREASARFLGIGGDCTRHGCLHLVTLLGGWLSGEDPWPDPAPSDCKGWEGLQNCRRCLPIVRVELPTPDTGNCVQEDCKEAGKERMLPSTRAREDFKRRMLSKATVCKNKRCQERLCVRRL